MLDLETLGVTPGCAILSIGAVFFDPKTGEEGKQFYQAIECIDTGLEHEPATIAWWDKQSHEARAVFTDPNRTTTSNALEAFRNFLQTYNPGQMNKANTPLIWGNGADFDNPILSVAAVLMGAAPLWPPYNGRCYRTVKNLFPSVKMQRTVGVHHNALADARNQAQHLMAIARVADVVWE